MLIKPREIVQHFTPLNEKRAQIMHEICHTSLLEFPSDARGKMMGKERSSWCDFHRAPDHTTEDCWELKTQIEGLVQSGHLSRYVQHSSSRRPSRPGRESSQSREADRQERSRSRQKTPGHKGTISTISGGNGRLPWLRELERPGSSNTDRGQRNSTGQEGVDAIYHLRRQGYERRNVRPKRTYGNLCGSGVIQSGASPRRSRELGEYPL
ncbi:hypothetical protein CR513_27965, partial [Mucuna pruriens]